MKHLKEPITFPFCQGCKNNYICNGNLNSEKLKLEVQTKEFLSFQKDDFLYSEGEDANGIYCIYSGEVVLEKKVSPYLNSIHGLAKVGEVVGFNSVSKGKYINSARSLNDTKVCFIKNGELQNYIKLLSSTTEFILNSKY